MPLPRPRGPNSLTAEPCSLLRSFYGGLGAAAHVPQPCHPFPLPPTRYCASDTLCSCEAYGVRPKSYRQQNPPSPLGHVLVNVGVTLVAKSVTCAIPQRTQAPHRHGQRLQTARESTEANTWRASGSRSHRGSHHGGWAERGPHTPSCTTHKSDKTAARNLRPDKAHAKLGCNNEQVLTGQQTGPRVWIVA